jgi:two-component system, OmpR family, response regulator VanR
MRLLYLEDQELVARQTARMLGRDGFSVDVVETGAKALTMAATQQYDVFLLDWNVPGDVNGMDVCRELRHRKDPAGIILLTGRTNLEDKVDAFGLGADDYLTKPFEYLELVARIRALMTRVSFRLQNPSIGAEPTDVRLLHAARVLRIASCDMELTPVEYKIMSALERARQRPLSAEKLCEAAWGQARDWERKSLYVHINQLRGKLGEKNAWRLETVRGEGYRLLLGEESARLKQS